MTLTLRISATQWSGGGASASIAGTFNSNVLVAYNGLAFAPSVPGTRNNDYNLINATASSVAYGTHTLTAPARHTSTDGLSDRIVLVTQNWTAGGSGLYNAHPIGIYYGGDTKWHIANIDGATMQQPLGFNVYAQEPSPNAFRVTAGSGNLVGPSLRLDHPLLDNIPCARPQATRLFGASFVTSNFDVEYGGGKWYIYGYSGISAGEQFHVLIDPAQVFNCTDRIFADGLQ